MKFSNYYIQISGKYIFVVSQSMLFTEEKSRWMSLIRTGCHILGMYFGR